MYEIRFYQQLLTKQVQFVWAWKDIPNNFHCPANWPGYKIIHIYFSRLLLRFQINDFTIFIECMDDFWNNGTMVGSANIFYIAIASKNKSNIKVAASK